MFHSSSNTIQRQKDGHLQVIYRSWKTKWPFLIAMAIPSGNRRKSPGRLQPEQPVGRAHRPRVERQRLRRLGVGAPRLRQLLAGLAVTAVMSTSQIIQLGCIAGSIGKMGNWKSRNHLQVDHKGLSMVMKTIHIGCIIGVSARATLGPMFWKPLEKKSCNGSR